IAIAFGVVLVLPSTRALAVGDASFALSPNSGSYTIGSTITVQITETSSSADDVNGVQANLSYPTSLLQYDSSSINGPFTLCAQGPEPPCFDNGVNSGSIDIAAASGSAASGTSNIAEVTF